MIYQQIAQTEMKKLDGFLLFAVRVFSHSSLPVAIKMATEMEMAYHAL